MARLYFAIATIHVLRTFQMVAFSQYQVSPRRSEL